MSLDRLLILRPLLWNSRLMALLVQAWPDSGVVNVAAEDDGVDEVMPDAVGAVVDIGPEAVGQHAESVLKEAERLPPDRFAYRAVFRVGLHLAVFRPDQLQVLALDFPDLVFFDELLRRI